MSLLAGYTRRLVRGRERRTGLVFEFVVDRLDVGDSDALLCTHPVGGATQHRAETLELRRHHGAVAVPVAQQQHRAETLELRQHHGAVVVPVAQQHPAAAAAEKHSNCGTV